MLFTHIKVDVMVIVYWIDLFDAMYSGTWYLLKVLYTTSPSPT